MWSEEKITVFSTLVFQPTPKAKFGHYYNLTRHMDEQQISAADVDYVNFSDLIACQSEQ